MPPVLSGRFGAKFYHHTLGAKENVGFSAKSSLAPIYFEYPRFEVHATTFALRGFFEWRNIVIANTVCRTGDCIVDVGSNIGTETLLFAKTVGSSGRVVAFEPSPDNFETLRHLKELNHLDQLDLRSEAVSDKIAELKFLMSTDEVSTGVGRIVTEQDQRAITVNSVTLDSLYEEGAIPNPRLIVMDVEGAEYLVIRGGKLLIERARPTIILEIEPPLLAQHNLDSTQIYELLSEHGYACYLIDQWGLTEVNGDDAATKRGNWFCVMRDDNDRNRLVSKINKNLRRAALLPLIPGINPAVINR